MTDERIADQIFHAARQSFARYQKAIKVATSQDERDRAVIAEFLSGANQLCHFLIANDGAVTPQQLERGIKLAGEAMGFKLGPPA